MDKFQKYKIEIKKIDCIKAGNDTNFVNHNVSGGVFQEYYQV